MLSVDFLQLKRSNGRQQLRYITLAVTQHAIGAQERNRPRPHLLLQLLQVSANNTTTGA